MKFCYADESGLGSEPVLVVAGVVTDAIRMHKTKSDWEDLLAQLSDLSDGKVVEVKGRELYRGNDYWRAWDAGERTSLIDQILKWMTERNHSVAFGAISKARLADARSQFDLDGLEHASEWCVPAMHLMLSIQKHHQTAKANKGKTVFVFDNASGQEELLALSLAPPAVTDGFYRRKKKQRALDQVIDVPYFADSQHVGLIQVADLFAFFLRLYAELTDDLTPEKFDGEFARLRGWINQIRPLILPDASRWPKTARDPCATFFRAAAPPALLEFAE